MMIHLSVSIDFDNEDQAECIAGEEYCLLAGNAGLQGIQGLVSSL